MDAGDVGVAEDALERHRVALHPHEVGREAVPEQVRIDTLCDRRPLGRHLEHVLHRALR